MDLNENVQLASAVQALKAEPNPVRLEDFALELGRGFELLMNRSSKLYQRFVEHERVQVNSVNGTLTYKPDFAIKSKEDISELLHGRWDTYVEAPGGGDPRKKPRLPLKPAIKLSDLRESWSEAKQAVEQLDKFEPREERPILVWRQPPQTKDIRVTMGPPKEATIKSVIYNPVRGAVCKAPEGEFKELWHSLHLPKELARAHAVQGTAAATAAGSDQPDQMSTGQNVPISAFGTGNMMHGDKSKSAAVRGTRGGRGRGRGRGRGASQTSSRKPKIQNTHLEGIDLTKDYV